MTDFAIVGMGCRFPGSNNSLSEFWRSLVESRDCTEQTQRWSTSYYTDSDSGRPGRIISSRGGFMDSTFAFDNEAFQMSQKEAASIDPQQKVLLEVANDALLDARSPYRGTDTGVFIGTGQIDFGKMAMHNAHYVNEYTATGSALSIHANRISYTFDLRGPSISIDTACSSSGTAMHLAIQSIASGACEQALVGGVNIVLNQAMTAAFSKLGVLSPDGICRSFDIGANGYVRSEGCGVVLVKPLAAARRDGDHIYCVLHAVTANQDGAQSPSLTMPSASAQGSVIQRALSSAKIDPQAVFYCEAHATGTLVGDPIEINNLGAQFGKGRDSGNELRIGSVKTNLGHLECASFMAGLIKCALMLDNRTLVPSINFETPNPRIDFSGGRLAVQTKVEPLPADERQVIMAVSSFGFGGANICALLSSAPPPSDNEVVGTGVDDDATLPWVVFSRSKAAMGPRLAQWKELEASGVMKTDLAYTMASESSEDARFVLSGVGASLAQAVAANAEPQRVAEKRLPLCFVFSGQGPQNADMGRGLYRHFPAFRTSIDRADALYRRYAGLSMVDDVGLFGAKECKDPQIVHRVDITLPALIMMQIALFELWCSFGIRPDFVIGHSFGEMCAVYASGACSLDLIMRLVAARAVLMAQLGSCGTMIALGCGAATATEIIKATEGKEIWIAAYNSPESTTLGGIEDSVDAVAAECERRGIFNRRLAVTNAYHTPLLSGLRDDALDKFSALVGDETICPRGGPDHPRLISTVTGKEWTTPFDHSYYWDNIQSAVHFEPAVAEARALALAGRDDELVFLEMAPHPVLSMSLKQCGATNVLYAVHRREVEVDSTMRMLVALARHGAASKDIDWSTVFGGLNKPLSPLLRPPYPYQRREGFNESELHRSERLIVDFGPLKGHRILHCCDTWQSYVNVANFPWLADHVVQNTVLFPAAAYIEAFLEVAGPALAEVSILSAMTVPTDTALTLMHTVVVDGGVVKLFTRTEGSKEWILHATAQGASPAGSLPAAPVAPDVAALRARCPKALESAGCYQRFSVMRLDYGAAFRCIETLYMGDEESLALLDCSHLPRRTTSDGGFVLHPALLDCCFQAFLGGLPGCAVTFLPTHMAAIRVYDQARIATITHFWVHCELLAVGDSRISGRVRAWAACEGEGEVGGGGIEATPLLLFEVEGFECTKVPAPARPTAPLYRTVVQSVTFPPQSLSLIPIAAEADHDVIAWREGVLPRLDALDDALAHYLRQALPELADLEAASEHMDGPRLRRYFGWARGVVERSKARAGEGKGETPVMAVLEELEATGFALEVALIRRVGSQLARLVRNEDNCVGQIMFGDDLMTRIYGESVTFRRAIVVMESVVAQITAGEDRVVRVLEVGAGTGAMSRALVPLLGRMFPNRIEYFFTDVSAAFLAADKQKAGDFDFVQYRVVDINRSLAEQGIPDASIDMLLGFDVIHTADVLRDSLTMLSTYLAPGGVLMLIEPTRCYDYMHFIFGVFREWWGYSDVRRQCCLTDGEWHEMLPQCGFADEVQTLSQDDEVHSLVIACRRIATHDDLKKSGSNADAKEVVPDFFDSGDAHAFLDMLQQRLREKSTQPLVVLTRGALAAPFDTSHACVLGMARVFVNETSGSGARVVVLDLAPDASADEAVTWKGYVTQQLSQGAGLETELVVRGGKLMVPRIVPVEESHLPLSPKSGLTQSFHLEVDTPGLLDSLQYRYFSLPETLPEKHARVRVLACALNFKDVMLAMNLLDLKDSYLGLEFAGVVEEAAAGSPWKAGDEVMGFARNCLASHVLAHEDMMVCKPPSLTMAEASSVPAVYVTVYVALVEKAGVSAGDHVLVHSAAGGVGQAAIQLITHLGGTVHATVGSESKREFLRKEYGVEHFADSHSDYWDSDVREQTPGARGVDVVLNSLSGANIERGIRVLAPYGSFCEIGKRDILNNSKIGMGPLLQNLNMYSIHLDLMTEQRPALVGQLLRKVVALLEVGKLRPIIDRTYPARDVLSAMRFMQSGKHMGKLVLDFTSENGSELPAVLPPRECFTPFGTYVLIGGLGSVGFAMAQWMVEAEGARNIVLTSRSPRSSKAQVREMARLAEKYGARVEVIAADSANRTAVARLAARMKELGLPIVRGVVNLAMVLDDDIVSKLTHERLQKVLDAKVASSENVVAQFGAPAQGQTETELEFLMLFSSISAPIGNPEQANYAAANAFLDVYAHTLLARGLPAHVLNVGAVSDIGVIATDFRLRKQLMAKGLLEAAMPAREVLASVKYMLQHGSLVQAMNHIDFGSICESSPQLASKWNHLVSHATVNDGEDDVTDPKEVFLKKLAGLLMISEELDLQENLTAYGVDSLLATELSALCAQILKVRISQVAILGGSSISSIFALMD